MTLSPAEREDRIERYARGPARLKAALGRVPEEARKWRPGPGKWSVHEVVCHCADAELNAAARVRYLVAEKDALIVGYDQRIGRGGRLSPAPPGGGAADGGGGARQHRGPAAAPARRAWGAKDDIRHAATVSRLARHLREHLEATAARSTRSRGLAAARGTPAPEPVAPPSPGAAHLLHGGALLVRRARGASGYLAHGAVRRGARLMSRRPSP